MHFMKSIQRCIYDILLNKYHFLAVCVFILVILCFSHLGEVLNAVMNDSNHKPFCGEPIDVVYTWVNGSDPNFRDSLNTYLHKGSHMSKDYSDERFDDKYELKFSLRSLEKYAPWVNHVYIVTNGQIPYWLNLDYEKVTVVSHEDIFLDLDNLPTFSSPAIERNIHRIPGLSNKFIYFNDDIFLGAPTFPEDFFSSCRGYLVYLAWPLPSCVPNCPWVYVGDGQCDSSCYNLECQFDGGDCSDNSNPFKPNSHNLVDHHEEESEETKHGVNYDYYEEEDAQNRQVFKRDLNFRDHNLTYKNFHKLSNKTKRLGRNSRSVANQHDLRNYYNTNGSKKQHFLSGNRNPADFTSHLSLVKNDTNQYLQEILEKLPHNSHFFFRNIFLGINSSSNNNNNINNIRILNQNSDGFRSPTNFTQLSNNNNDAVSQNVNKISGTNHNSHFYVKNVLNISDNNNNARVFNVNGSFKYAAKFSVQLPVANSADKISEKIRKISGFYTENVLNNNNNDHADFYTKNLVNDNNSIWNLVDNSKYAPNLTLQFSKFMPKSVRKKRDNSLQFAENIQPNNKKVFDDSSKPVTKFVSKMPDNKSGAFVKPHLNSRKRSYNSVLFVENFLVGSDNNNNKNYERSALGNNSKYATNFSINMYGNENNSRAQFFQKVSKKRNHSPLVTKNYYINGNNYLIKNYGDSSEFHEEERNSELSNAKSITVMNYFLNNDRKINSPVFKENMHLNNNNNAESIFRDSSANAANLTTVNSELSNDKISTVINKCLNNNRANDSRVFGEKMYLNNMNSIFRVSSENATNFTAELLNVNKSIRKRRDNSAAFAEKNNLNQNGIQSNFIDNNKPPANFIAQLSNNNTNMNRVLTDILKKQQTTSFIKNALLSNKTHVPKIVDEHNRKVILNDKLKRKKRLYTTLRKRKKYYKNMFNATNIPLVDANNTKTKPEKARNLDTYALSLQHTNRVFNLAYGFKARKVPAHSPILIEKQIMENLQKKFRREFERTEKNKLRSENDMQYSFSYYYYVINEKATVNSSEIFDMFDTDGSNTWSDREIRTVLTKMNELPLNYGMVEIFDNAIINCSKNVKVPEVTVPPYERYIDSKLPVVSKQLVLNCPFVINMLTDKFGVKPKYEFEVIKNAQSQHVMFKMLTSNISEVVGHLDEIRKEPRKFVCLNDNMNPKKIEENDLVKAILLDFYLSLFPKPSKFELPQEYRNRFSYIKDLNEWKQYHMKLKLFLLICVIIIGVISFYNVCKRRILRQVKRIIYF